MLRSCTAPLYNHSLINLNWPFVLRELHVCSACILCFAHVAHSKTRAEQDRDNDSATTPISACELALNTYLFATLRTSLSQQERLHRKSSSTEPIGLSDIAVQRICRVSVQTGTVLSLDILII
ncbi:unnamed protein product [Echinostoma caproni]|uniref:Secreted protein n=1 Tax=Echinostoma caproni TaxID=27848 RepID=A0A183ASP0_9TREM|nr:unnamed protein product [Echinostoma caproni]